MLAQQLALWCLLASLHAGLTAACPFNQMNATLIGTPRRGRLLGQSWQGHGHGARWAGGAAHRPAPLQPGRASLSRSTSHVTAAAGRLPRHDPRPRCTVVATAASHWHACATTQPGGPQSGPAAPGAVAGAVAMHTAPPAAAASRFVAQTHRCTLASAQQIQGGVARCAPLARVPALKAAALRRRASHQHAQLHKMAALASKSAVRAAAFSGRVTRPTSCHPLHTTTTSATRMAKVP